MYVLRLLASNYCTLVLTILSPQESCLVEFPEFVGSIDHKLCPSCPTLPGCVYEGDLWVLDAKTGKKHQLTKTAGN